LPRGLRRRYIAAKIEGVETGEERDIFNAVSLNLLKLFGEYGVSLAELTLIDFNSETSHAIFRCNHSALEMAKTSISALTEVGRKRAATEIVYVSGTLKAIRRRISS